MQAVVSLPTPIPKRSTFVMGFGPLKGPTDVGTAREEDTEVALSTLVDKLNECFGTDFTKADQLVFDQLRQTAKSDEKVVEAAQANNLSNFSAYFGRMMKSSIA